MTGPFVLAWTAADGSRHANPIGREDYSVVYAVGDLNRREAGGAVYVQLLAEDLQSWKEKATMDTPTETWANAEAMMFGPGGDPVPAKLVPGRIKLEDQTVRILVEKAKAMQAAMASFKLGAFSDIYAFLDELAAAYGVQRAGKRGGVQLNSYDGLSKVEVSVADTLAFGPELLSAQELINECIQSWTQGANDNLRVVVNDAFRVGRGGKIRVDRVIGLRRLEIDDPRWKMAMVAIADAIRSQGSVSYIRFYQRASQDVAWQHIALDMSRVA